jgi:hypothetical protein
MVEKTNILAVLAFQFLSSDSCSRVSTPSVITSILAGGKRHERLDNL